MDYEVESEGSNSCSRCATTINDLPDEVLEYILSLVSPYKDMKECMLVCRRWHQSVKNVSRLLNINLTKAIRNLDITWETLTPVEMAPSITKRYSHSACYHDHSMYVFGGCTSSSTTFNDLWRLDLTKRQWVRPLTMGTYPSPKACASMVYHRKGLILFGGWSHPSPYPLHQGWRLFNELHIYSIKSNRWTCINTTNHPPAMAGHSASVHGDTMVVFGGVKSTSVGNHVIVNDVWCFDLENQEWKEQETDSPKPDKRYGQSQIAVDKDHILIIGGCGGPNEDLNDIWLLTMKGNVWHWKEIKVLNPEWSAPHIWCHPACKIGEQVVVLSRYPAGSLMPRSKWRPPVSPASVLVPSGGDEGAYGMPRRYSEENVHSAPPIDRDLNVNGRRGSFNTRQPRNNDDNAAGSSGLAPRNVRARLGRPSPSASPPNEGEGGAHPPPRRGLVEREDERTFGRIAGGAEGIHMRVAQRAREHLDYIHRMAEDLKNMDRLRSRSMSCAFSKPCKIAMAMYVLDISKVLEERLVMWVSLRRCPRPLVSPEETILYSLVAGKGELIMFGGVQKDAISVTSQAMTPSQNIVSNSLHFISAPKGVI